VRACLAPVLSYWDLRSDCTSGVRYIHRLLLGAMTANVITAAWTFGRGQYDMLGACSLFGCFIPFQVVLVAVDADDRDLWASQAHRG